MTAPHLTSAERRGILSVAAASLLCIGAGVIVRQCNTVYIRSLPPAPATITILSDTATDMAPAAPPDTADSKAPAKGHRSSKKSTAKAKAAKEKKSKTKSAKNKSKKRTPSPKLPPRDPLSEPIPTR